MSTPESPTVDSLVASLLALQEFVNEIAELKEAPASARIVQHDPRGMLDIIIENAKSLRRPKK